MIVEDHEALRNLLAHLINQEPDLEVVALAATLHEALRYVYSAGFDVALLDTKLPDGYGTDLITNLRERCPGCRAVVMSAAMGPESLARASRAGADAVVDKLGGVGEIVGAIRRVANG